MQFTIYDQGSATICTGHAVFYMHALDRMQWSEGEGVNGNRHASAKNWSSHSISSARTPLPPAFFRFAAICSFFTALAANVRQLSPRAAAAWLNERRRRFGGLGPVVSFMPFESMAEARRFIPEGFTPSRVCSAVFNALAASVKLLRRVPFKAGLATDRGAARIPCQFLLMKVSSLARLFMSASVMSPGLV